MPAPFGSVHDRQARADVELGALIGAKVAQRDALDAHRRSRIEADRHDEVDELAPSADSISPGRSGARQLDHDLLRVDALEPVAQELGVEADLERLAG